MILNLDLLPQLERLWVAEVEWSAFFLAKNWSHDIRRIMYWKKRTHVLQDLSLTLPLHHFRSNHLSLTETSCPSTCSRPVVVLFLMAFWIRFLTRIVTSQFKGLGFESQVENLRLPNLTWTCLIFVLAAASPKFPKIQKIHVIATAAREYPDPTIPDRVSLGDADHSWSDSQVPSGLIR